MGIAVDPDWWKTLFDEVYLMTDARTVCDDDTTRREIDIFCQLLPMLPEDRILDLCGGHARHSLELSRRGYRNCTVVDYSRPLLRIGAERAGRESLPVAFVSGDARQTGLADGVFDYVLILGNSLGYIPIKDADLQILQESARILKPGGRLLLDVADGRAASKKLAPSAWHEIGEDVVVCRYREKQSDMVCAREMVLSKKTGLIRDRTYCIRLYTPEGLTELANRSGFEDVCVYAGTGSVEGTEDVGCMNHRMILCARKPSDSE